MFCPSCGVREDRPVQFCRTCGTDLRAVRTSLEQPDLITASAAAAREEIGRAVAARIKEMERVKELEDVLPAVEKFMESPQERRLRRMRAGVLTASVGLGATLLFFLLSLTDKDAFFLIGVGIIVFLIGLGIVINGLTFTVLKELAPDRSPKQSPQELTNDLRSRPADTQDIAPMTQEKILPRSVTEQTTQHLSSELLKTPPHNNAHQL